MFDKTKKKVINTRPNKKVKFARGKSPHARTSASLRPLAWALEYK